MNHLRLACGGRPLCSHGRIQSVSLKGSESSHFRVRLAKGMTRNVIKKISSDQSPSSTGKQCREQEQNGKTLALQKVCFAVAL